MTGRSTKEWVGLHPDSPIPPRVRLRVFERTHGACALCTRKLVPGQWACDHIKALTNGGEHRESNLQALCISPCHSSKTREDVAMKSEAYGFRLKAAGIKAKKGRPMAGSKASGFKRKMDGTVVKR